MRALHRGVSGVARTRLAWRDRAVGHLLTVTAQAGDVILCAKVSCMARSTPQVLAVLEDCMPRAVHIHIARQRMVAVTPALITHAAL
jgi:hypothetical protein